MFPSIDNAVTTTAQSRDYNSDQRQVKDTMIMMKTPDIDSDFNIGEEAPMNRGLPPQIAKN